MSGPIQRPSLRLPLRLRALLGATVLFAAGAATWACGVSLSGTGDGTSAGPDASADTSVEDAPIVPEDAPSGDDADASDPVDATDADAADGPSCALFDSGVGGPLDLSAFVVRGNATYNENSDGLMTLTNSNHDEKGAAWDTTSLPAIAGYDLTWHLRSGPGDTAGDGVTFAVLQGSAAAPPDVGEVGDGLGLRKIASADGGVPSGYAVAIDMYKDGDDPGVTTLKLIAMPDFRLVKAVGVDVALNDGNTYAVDVRWRGTATTGTLTAILHQQDAGVGTISASDTAFAMPAPMVLGFTSSTGAGAKTHNEVGGVTLSSTCQ